ncbi:MAG: KpsF/GutQ family sugar-phosphate isomerase [bacterium]
MIVENARRVLKIEAKAILELADHIDESFTSAVREILSCKGKVIVTGMGKSGHIGGKIAATLASTGTPAFFLHPAEAMHGDLGMVSPGDIVIAISHSGESEELNSIIPTLKVLGVKIIAITGNPESNLSRNADIILETAVKEEACPLGLAPTASTTAALALGDALAISLLQERGFKEDDFAFFHPAGALGKKLLEKTVGELMSTGEEVPIVRDDAGMERVISEMTAKNLGATTVVDGRGILVGIITDGDLRRNIKDILSKRAGDVMTRNPKTIGRDELAAKAVALMEEFNITVLPITDESGRPIGIVHLHTLLKARRETIADIMARRRGSQ